tara:strand:- start:161 stop:1165 length:1005 start_codon:yes stop_codon:yes gene_type:complete
MENIRIGFKKNKIVSGPNNFLNRLKYEFSKKNGISAVNNINFFKDISIYNSVSRFSLFKPYILRLDQLYYDSNNESANKLLNQKIFKSIEKADGVIYQSEWAKKLYDTQFKPIKKPHCIIRNGIEIPNKPAIDEKINNLKKEKLIIACSANWRNHKRLDGIINVIIELNKQLYCELIVIGEVNKKRKDLPYIKYLGNIKSYEVIKNLNKAHIFIHLSWLEACPNSVVEAVGNYVPTICNNVGGTREVIEVTNGGLISECDDEALLDNLLYRKKTLDLESPPKIDYKVVIDDIFKLINNYEYYFNLIVTTNIDIVNISNKYLDFINKVLDRKKLR